MAEKIPETVEELFPSRWLKCADLQAHSVMVKIAAVNFQDFHQPDGSIDQKAVVEFQGKTKQLILNKTQAKALAEVCGSERLLDWIGRWVLLVPAEAENRKPTIAIEPAPAGTTR